MPSNKSALRFATFVVEATTNGAVPVATSDSKVFALISKVPISISAEAVIPAVVRAVIVWEVVVPPITPLIVGAVKVLFVRVSVVALPTSVSAEAGNVTVTSAVDAGPMRVTLFAPLSESSKNSRKPALVVPFFSWIPALAIGVVSVGVVKGLFVNVDVVALTYVSICDALTYFSVPPSDNKSLSVAATVTPEPSG